MKSIMMALVCLCMVACSNYSGNQPVAGNDVVSKPRVKPVVYAEQNELNTRMHVYRIETDSSIVVFLPKEAIQAMFADNVSSK